MPLPFGIDFSKQKEAEQKCFLCSSSLDKAKHKPRKEWNLDGLLCDECYNKKENYCTYCQAELKGKKITPKKEWALSGYLCEVCYEFRVIEEDANLGKTSIEVRAYDIAYAEIADRIMQSLIELRWKVKSGDIKTGKIAVETSEGRFGGRETLTIFERESKGNVFLLVQHPKLKDKSRSHATTFFQILEKQLGTTTETIHVAGNICEICTHAKATKFGYAKEVMCDKCFEKKFGIYLLSSSSAQYFGGHKAHLAGGFFSKEDNGNLLLTTSHLIFEKRSRKESDRWKIIIPLSEVITERWTVKEEARRTTAMGTGAGFPTLLGVGGVGSGVLHQEGKRHELVVPYIDENGIPQEPRFGVSSFSGKAIKQWAARLYEVIVDIKGQQEPSQKIVEQNAKGDTKIDKEDPFLVLKLRLARGEITKEEYEELRKMLES